MFPALAPFGESDKIRLRGTIGPRKLQRLADTPHDDHVLYQQEDVLAVRQQGEAVASVVGDVDQKRRRVEEVGRQRQATGRAGFQDGNDCVSRSEPLRCDGERTLRNLDDAAAKDEAQVQTLLGYQLQTELRGEVASVKDGDEALLPDQVEQRLLHYRVLRHASNNIHFGGCRGEEKKCNANLG
jgi:hypothetical protein